MAADDEDVIDHAVVKIGADTSGLRREMERGVLKATAGVKIKIPMEVDKDATQAGLNYVANLRFKYFQEQERLAQAHQDKMDARHRAALISERNRTRTWREQLTHLQQQADAHDLQRVRTTAERRQHLMVAGEQAAYRAAEALRKQEAAAAERADRDSARRRAALTKRITPPTLVDFGGEGFKPMALLYSSVAALTPALLAMASSAAQAATSVAALGAAGIGAGLAIGGLALSFGSVTDALNLSKTVDTEGLVKSAKQAATTSDDQARATRELANAQRDEKEAYAGIHKARQEAIRDLEDLRQAVQDLDNQYKSDRLSVAEAERDETLTRNNFFATALDRARAHQNLLDARTRFADTALQRKQKQQDLSRSLKQGIEGSDKVRQAKEQARDARDRRLDAQAAASKKMAASLGGATSASEQLKKKLAEMSPAARDMYEWFRANDKKLKDLRRTIEQGVLPGFTTFLEEVNKTPKGGGKTTLQLAAKYAADLGGIISKYAGRFGKFTNSTFFRESMATIQENNATALEKMGKAAERLIRPITRIITAASPLLVKFADKIVEIADKFDAFIEARAKDGSLKKWFEDAATQAGLWWDVLKNVFTFLKDIFRASLPSGGSLVQSLRDFTDRLAKWSSSSDGQRNIRHFFEIFRDLPYGRIRDFLFQFSELFIAMHAFQWAKANPFWSALGVFAASHPDAAAKLVGMLSDFVESLAGLMASQPEATAFILGLVALGKLNKAGGGILFKLSGMEKLTSMLRGKFSILDKFLGGGATTGVMNVRAGVVNVYGGVGGGGGFPGGPGGKGGPKGGPRGGVSSPLLLGGGLTTAAVLAGIFGTQGFNRAGKGQGFGQPIKDFFNDPSWATFMNTLQMASPIGWAGYFLGQPKVKTLLKLANPLNLLKKHKPGKTAIDPYGFSNTKTSAAESYGLSRFINNLQSFGSGHIVTKDAMTDYIDARKRNVKEYVDFIRGKDGPVAAAKLQQAEDRRSVDTLAGLLTQYGWAKDKAHDFATKQFDVAKHTREAKTAAEEAKPKFDDLGNSVDSAAGKAEKANTKMHTLSSTIDGIEGKHVIGLDTQGYDKVAKQLDLLWQTQHVLYNPKYSNSAAGADTVSSQSSPVHNTYKKNDPKNLLSPVFKAGGGSVKGAGTWTSDSIPAWLSNGEYVIPAKQVQHYGVSTFDAYRKGQMPRFAGGGEAGRGTMPFTVNLPLKGLQVPKVPEVDPGVGWTPFKGPIPKGVGMLKGLSGPLAAAAIDAHRMVGASVTSGLRTGRAAITVTGNKSYHGSGRAIDLVPPSMALFNYLKAKYDGAIKELIYSPAGNMQVWHGKNHMYSDPRIRRTHYNHVHLALAQGGLVQANKYDKGGVLPPGYSLAFNGTGRPETVRTSQQERNLQSPVRLDRRDLALLAASITGGGPGVVNMDGRKVAELTNRYNYLPSGV